MDIMNQQEQIKAQELYSQGYIYTRKMTLRNTERFILSNGILTKIISKNIYNFIKSLEN